MGRRRWLWIVGGVVVLVVAANALNEPADEEPTMGACEKAFAEAAAVDELQDTNEDMFPAVRACGSLEEWTAASDQYPDALDGVDPETYLTTLCANYTEISTEPLCP